MKTRFCQAPISKPSSREAFSVPRARPRDRLDPRKSSPQPLDFHRSPEPGLASGVQDGAFTYVGRSADDAGSELSGPGVSGVLDGRRGATGRFRIAWKAEACVTVPRRRRCRSLAGGSVRVVLVARREIRQTVVGSSGHSSAPRAAPTKERPASCTIQGCLWIGRCTSLLPSLSS